MTVKYPDDMPAEVRAAYERYDAAKEDQHAQAIRSAQANAAAYEAVVAAHRVTGWHWPENPSESVS